MGVRRVFFSRRSRGLPPCCPFKGYPRAISCCVQLVLLFEKKYLYIFTRFVLLTDQKYESSVVGAVSY